jgi:hypothetical protein
MTTGDASMADEAEVEKLMKAGARAAPKSEAAV